MTNPTDTNQASEVLQGDCLELMKDIPDGSVDMILADLPYGTTACKWDTIIPFEPLWEQYKRVIKPNGAIVLTASQPFTSALVMSNPKMFRYSWVWKKQPTMFQHSKNRPMQATEDILIFSINPWGHKAQLKERRMNYFPQGAKIGAVKKFHGVQGKYIGERPNQVGKEYTTMTGFPSNFLDIPRESKNIHPTQKPVALFEYLIKTYTSVGDVVLDNVAGSGTTGVACQNLNRNFILMEQEPEYVEIIKQTLELNKERLTKLETEVKPVTTPPNKKEEI